MQKSLALQKLGAHIRKLREELGYSQEDFAAEVGFDRTYYGGIERGERNLSAINLIKLAQTMKAEVGELFPPIKTFTKGG